MQRESQFSGVPAQERQMGFTQRRVLQWGRANAKRDSLKRTDSLLTNHKEMRR